MAKSIELDSLDKRLTHLELGVKRLDKSIKDLKAEVIKTQQRVAEIKSLLNFLKELEKPNE